MAEGLATHLADERSQAVRLLLGSPLIDTGHDPDSFAVVVRHRDWLVPWFESTCGWAVHVDVAAGYARLAKRAPTVDTSRPLRRTRGERQPFDRRRYELLCRVAGELVHHPVTTIGLLASAIAADATLDTTNRNERSALVDALRALVGWGALVASGGEVDAFVDDAQGNAILTADTARLHRLLSCATAPSSLRNGIEVDGAVGALLAEPRYGEAPRDPAAADEQQRLRWVRHRLARRLLDDPVVHLDELSDAEREYLTNPAGRRWLRDRAAEAGLDLEERAEGLLAVDTGGLATDQQFPAPNGHAHQLALLLIDRLSAGSGVLGPAELRIEVDAVLRRFRAWARSHRDGDGPDRLAAEAVALLVRFGLVTMADDGTVTARPVLARYRVVEPVVTGTAQESMFEEGS